MIFKMTSQVGNLCLPNPMTFQVYDDPKGPCRYTLYTNCNEFTVISRLDYRAVKKVGWLCLTSHRQQGH